MAKRHFFASRTTTGEKIFTVCNYIMLTFLAIITIFPFYVTVVKSFAPPQDFIGGEIIWWPSEYEWSYYASILSTKSEFIMCLKNTLYFVTVGTFCQIFTTFIAAFVLSQKKMPFRPQITFIMVFTMFFGGGMIPSFVLARNLGLINKMFGLILMGIVGTMYVLYLRNFIMTIPLDITESAFVDGCPEYKLFYKIIFPLTLPALATFTLFYAVGQWNQFMGAIIYLTDPKKYPLQVYVWRTVTAATVTSDPDELRKLYEGGYQPPADALKACAVVCSTVPIVCVYPFLQKYFVTGMMMGSLKG